MTKCMLPDCKNMVVGIGQICDECATALRAAGAVPVRKVSLEELEKTYPRRGALPEVPPRRDVKPPTADVVPIGLPPRPRPPASPQSRSVSKLNCVEQTYALLVVDEYPEFWDEVHQQLARLGGGRNTELLSDIAAKICAAAGEAFSTPRRPK